MKQSLVIMKKELDRVLSDKRLFLTIFIFPGIVLYIVYSLLGGAFNNPDILFDMSPDSEYEGKIYTKNMTTELENYIESNTEDIDLINLALVTADEEQIKDDISDEKKSLMVILDENFQDQIDSYDDSNNYEKAGVELFYNENYKDSITAYNHFAQILNGYTDQVLGERLGGEEYANVIDYSENKISNLEKAFLNNFSLLITLLIVSFIVTAISSVAVDSVSGEKERNTLSTVLVTPIKLSSFALGKIASIFILATFCFISGATGVVLGTQNAFGVEKFANVLNLYNFLDFFKIISIVLLMILFMVALSIIVSAYARNIKETNSLLVPVFVTLYILIGVGIFAVETLDVFMIHALPFINLTGGLHNAVTLDLNINSFLIIVVSSIIHVFILFLILSSMLKKEKILFKK
ncbi:MAG: ABC transporter permease [Candidatus Woesearchaeota archaeon]